MYTSVNIGSTQDFRLSRALLVYGKSSYDAFPYRHPFIAVHEVIHDDDGARLAEGQLVTPQMLIDPMVSLGQSVPIEILPDRVIVRTPDTIVWWTPARERIMFFSDRSDDAALKKMNGKRYPHPPLLFKTSGTRLSVRALLENKRPKSDTKLFTAPYWNCYENGVVCTGTMKIPREKSVAAIETWEESFFQSVHAWCGRAQPCQISGRIPCDVEVLGSEEEVPRPLFGGGEADIDRIREQR
jgi:PRTRC genetic system protein B